MDEFRFGREEASVTPTNTFYFVEISHWLLPFSTRLTLVPSLLFLFYADGEIGGNIPSSRFHTRTTIRPYFFVSFHCPIKALMTHWTEGIDSTQKADAKQKNDSWIIDYTLSSRSHFELKVRSKFHFLQNGISLCFKGTMRRHSLNANDKLLSTNFHKQKKHYVFSQRSVAWKIPTISL